MDTRFVKFVSTSSNFASKLIQKNCEIRYPSDAEENFVAISSMAFSIENNWLAFLSVILLKQIKISFKILLQKHQSRSKIQQNRFKVIKNFHFLSSVLKFILGMSSSCTVVSIILLTRRGMKWSLRWSIGTFSSPSSLSWVWFAPCLISSFQLLTMVSNTPSAALLRSVEEKFHKFFGHSAR